MSTQLDIVNRALSRLGAGRINALVATEGKGARAAISAWDPIREEVLRAAPWKSASKRTRLYHKTDLVENVTLATLPNRVRITLTNHDFEDGDYVLIEDVEGTTEVNTNWVLGNIQTNSVDLIDPATGDFVDGSAYTAYTTGGVVTLKCLFDYAERLPLPADYLRMCALYNETPDERWEVERKYLLTDRTPPVEIRYVYSDTQPEEWDALLVSAMAARLAVEMAEELTQSATKRQLAYAEWEELKGMAQGMDSKEQTPSDYTESSWIETRLR